MKVPFLKLPMEINFDTSCFLEMALRFGEFFSFFFGVSSHLPVLVSIRGRRGLGGRLVQGGRVQAESRKIDAIFY